MGYLDSLAGGLRAAAGIMSPEIQKQTAEEDQRNNLLRAQQAQMLVQSLQQQVANGSISPEQAAQGAQSLGVNVPAQVIGGPSLEARAKAVALAKETRREQILQLPQVQELIARGDTDTVNRVLLSQGLIDPMQYAKEVREGNKPVAIGRGGLAVPDPTQPNGYRTINGTATQTPIKIDRFPIGDGMVQPHISLDGGQTFKPIEGSKPISAKEVSGGVSIGNIYPPNAVIPGKPAQGKIDENLLDSTQTLMGLQQIEAGFKPEYQTIATKGANWWASTKEKAGVDLTETERKQLTEFSAYRRNAFDNLSKYIKQITGAAMSEAEAKRILKGMPNPGEGLFDGDSPTEFKAKQDDAIKATRMSIARLTYMKRNGMALPPDKNGEFSISLERMPALINQRATEIEQQVRSQNPSMQLADIRKITRRQIAQEFGLLE